MEKLTKKNSIMFNQLWINKAIEEGNYKFLPCRKDGDLSIGEIIEYNYEINNENELKKITKKNSLLFLREWLEKYKEEDWRIPRPAKDRSLAETLETKYYMIEIMRKQEETQAEKVLELGYKWSK